MTATTVELTRELPTSGYWEPEEDVSPNGPIWVCEIEEDWDAPADWKGTQQEWLIDNGWDGFESEEQWRNLGEAYYYEQLAPANDEPDGPYGLFCSYDSYPSYVFARKFVPMLLAMGIDEALEWLRTRAVTRRKSWGMPYYIHDSGDAAVTP